MISEHEIEELRLAVKLLKEENTLLHQQQEKSNTVMKLQQEQITLLKKLTGQLQKEIKKLHGQLRKFLNENTPSGSVPPYLKDELESAFPPENANTEKSGEGKQAKVNNRNKRPKPDKKKNHKIKNCPCCGKTLKPLKKKYRRIVIHLELPKQEVVEHISDGGYCSGCKKRFYAPVPDTLPNLKYSLDLAIFIVTLIVIYDMTQRKTSDLLGQFGVSISPASVNNVYHSVRTYLGEKKYREFEKDLKNSFNTHADETGHRHKGKTNWSWLVANARTVFLKITETRSGRVAKTLPLGKITNCDGYRAYDKAAKLIQRCWAKISRKARNPKYYFNDEAEIDQYKTFVTGLFQIFHDAKTTKERGKHLVKAFDARLRKFLLIPRKEEKNLIWVMNYILEYEGEWFTFLLRQGISPTNNRSEQKIRPLVIKRKISQHTMSEHGKRSLEVFFTLAQTCKERNQSFSELVRNEVEANLIEMRKS
jgi:transposase